MTGQTPRAGRRRSGRAPLRAGLDAVAAARARGDEYAREPRATLLDALPDKTRARARRRRTVTGVAYDSRKVGPGELFVAVRGLQAGRPPLHPRRARARRRRWWSPRAPIRSPAGAPGVLVPSRARPSRGSPTPYCGHPSRALTLVGVTGTNGKTTTSFLVEALLRAAGQRAGLHRHHPVPVGRARGGGEPAPRRRRSSSRRCFARDARRAATAACAMEVSSHALALCARATASHFDVAVFTNLTQDHLDFHGTMEAYFAAKRRLFERAARRKPRRDGGRERGRPAGAAHGRGLAAATA